ncbi:MAG TPA: anaerobic ribonucleoside-triphosphate reductase, partial [Mesotoga infera]|nr:anaerobic ribonucleoside-triphosphate reductase [Mesotoga infera]
RGKPVRMLADALAAADACESVQHVVVVDRLGNGPYAGSEHGGHYDLCDYATLAAPCPKCGAATEVYSRITGYYRPVQNWNIGKQEEFKRRKVYQIRRESIDELRRLGKSEPGRLSRESSPDGIYLKL